MVAVHYHVLATDYDGTIAEGGLVSAEMLAALREVKASGRKLVLVTGRELPDLQQIFPEHEIFEAIVAENGALIYLPAGRELKAIAPPPNEHFVERLVEAGVTPLSIGQSIVATTEEHQHFVLEAIRELGLELQLIFNKGALMILPSGINKSVGLRAALQDLRLSLMNTVGVGDAENDHAFLKDCFCSAAVQNALPALKEAADIVLPGPASLGVRQLIEQMIKDDLARFADRLQRHHLVLGENKHGERVTLPGYGMSMLIAGPSGAGKSTVVAGILERIMERGYQFCLIDPEGDYDTFGNAVRLGDPTVPATIDGVIDLLRQGDKSAIVNLLGTPLADRPAFFAQLMPRLQDLRVQLGHPHWITIDEAHHLLPREWQQTSLALPQRLDGLILITVHPDQIAAEVLQELDLVLAVGARPSLTFSRFARVRHLTPPLIPDDPPLASGEVVAWSLLDGTRQRVQITPGREDRKRHKRKYAAGDVREKAFYFEGPQGKLKLRAQNLTIFMQMAEGVDRETWLYHLRNGDYSEWIRYAIKDDALADQVQEIENNPDLPAEASLEEVKRVISRSYTLPA